MRMKVSRYLYLHGFIELTNSTKKKKRFIMLFFTANINHQNLAESILAKYYCQIQLSILDTVITHIKNRSIFA